MAMPAMPGAGFVVIKAELVLSGFEAVLDSPAMAFHRHQLLHGRALGAPCREEGQAAVGNVAADQKTPRPFPGKVVVVYSGVEIGQLKIGPVVPARTFGPFARRQAMPGLLGKALRDRRGSAGDRLRLATRTAPVRRSRDRSCDARSWASSQSPHRSGHVRPSGARGRPSIPLAGRAPG